MGAPALIVFKYKGLYYAYYRVGGTEPAHIGRKLVKRLVSDSGENLKRWREKFEKLRSRFYDQIFELSRESWLRLSENPRCQLPADLERKLHCFPSIWPCLNKGAFKWVYTVDLDLDVFSVNNTFHVSLDGLSEEWMDENNFNHTSNPLSAYEYKLLSKTVCQAQPETSTAGTMRSKHISRFRPTPTNQFSRTKLVAVCFAKQLYGQWMDTKHEALRILLPQWTHTDDKFKEIAMATLCFAAGGPEHLSFARTIQIGGCLRRGIVCRKWSHGRVSGGEPLREICSEFRFPQDHFAFTPSTPNFWFHGVMIRLVTEFGPDNWIDSIAEEIAEDSKSVSRLGFTAVIMSLKAIVIVRLSSHCVVRSDVLSLRTITTENKNEDQPAEPRQELPSMIPGHITPKPIPVTSNLDTAGDDGFMTLAHELEDAILRKLPFGNQAQGSPIIPIEIWGLILDQLHLLDYKTWLACFHVSVLFRSLCQRRCIMDEDSAKLELEEGNFYLKRVGDDVTSKRFSPLVGLSALYNYRKLRGMSESRHGWIPVLGTRERYRAMVGDGGFSFR